MNEALFETFEDTASFSFLGANVFLYGLLCAGGVLVTLLLFAAMCKKARMTDGTALVFGALALPIGLVVSRILFCLLDFGFHAVFSPRAAVSFWGGGYSMVGAIGGAALAAVLTAKNRKVSAAALLDILAVSFFAFIAFERIGESFTELMGRSRTLVEEVVKNPFFSETDGYDWKLKTYQFEYLTAFVLMFVCFCFYMKNKSLKGDTALLALLLFGATQTFWESLRFDSHMRRSFVDMQQILAAIMMALPAVLFTLRRTAKEKKNLPLYIIIGVLALDVGGIVGIEFMIDRTETSRLLLYAVYALLLAAPCALSLINRKKALNA